MIKIVWLKLPRTLSSRDLFNFFSFIKTFTVNADDGSNKNSLHHIFNVGGNVLIICFEPQTSK